MHIFNPITVSIFLSVKLSRRENQGNSKPLCLETDQKHIQCSIVHSNLWPLTKAVTFTFFNWLMHFSFFSFIVIDLVFHSNKISASPFGPYRSWNLSNFVDTYAPGATLYTNWHLRVPISPGVCKGTLRNSADFLNSAWQIHVWRCFFWYIYKDEMLSIVRGIDIVSVSFLSISK